MWVVLKKKCGPLSVIDYFAAPNIYRYQWDPNFGNHSHGFMRIVLDDCQHHPKLYLFEAPYTRTTVDTKILHDLNIL